jgi:hypothetical protein
MSIKQYGGVFGRNPTFNKVTADSVETNLLTVDRLSSDGTLIAFEKNGSTVGQIAVANSNNLTIGGMVAGHSGMQFGTGRIIPETAGVQSNGTVDLGQNSGRFKDAYLSGNVIVASGQGIDFSATSGTGTSELLDDYEEGDWTPLIADASSGGNAGSGSVVGKYTKVGRQVTIIAVLNNIVTTGLTAGNDLFLLGIPFTPSNFSTLTKNTAPVSTSTVDNAANSYLTAILHDNTNYMRIQENITNATNDYILVSEITSGTSDLNFTLTYFTDS